MLRNLLYHWRKLRVQTQLLVLLVFATVVAQAVDLAIQLKVREHMLNQNKLAQSFERIAAATDFMSRLSQEKRQNYLSSLNLGRERYILEATPFVQEQDSQPAQVEALTAVLQKTTIQPDKIRLFVGNVSTLPMCKGSALPELLTPPIGHYSTSSHPCYSELIASVHLPTMGWLNLSHNIRRPAPFYFSLYWLTNLLTLVLSIVVIIYALRSLLNPIRKLQQAVKRSGNSINPTLVDEQGAADIRELICEYNQMQLRNSRFVSNRTQLLAAISHDLRTPITSMRLRLDFLPESEEKVKLLESLSQLKATADASLNFVRETKSEEAFGPLDLLALAEVCCEDLAETGLPVEWVESPSTPEQAIVQGQTHALRRVLENLIQNAVNYGLQAQVSVTETATSYQVEVLDKGPGIPLDQQERVFEPFVRIEESRNQETGGIGLGLAIARSIADDHGGQILFHQLEGGFKVSLALNKSEL